MQFERLCEELLRLSTGASAAEWRFVPRGSALAFPEGLDAPGGERLTGPALAVIAWQRRGEGTEHRVHMTIHRALDLWSRSTFRSLLVLSNARPDSAPWHDMDVVWLGPDELSTLVAESWEVRLTLPPVLGIGAAEDLVDREAADRSTADLEAALGLARVFVPTRAHAAAVDVLTRRHFAVLTGPPEMGKTAIARVVGLAALTDGWEVHECVRPQQLWARFEHERRQVFIADDAFGSTEYRPDAAERWALELDRALRAMDERHWLIWTSRPAPLNAGLRRIHREHGVERFPQPAEVQVDAAELDTREKALILFRHAKAAALPPKSVELVRAEGWPIVCHPHFTPERIRRLVDGRLLELADQVGVDADLHDLLEAEIREPTEAMAASFGALAEDHRVLLVCLLDTPPGPVPERELASAYRRHSDAGMARPLREAVDRLSDHFVRVDDAGAVTWVHPSWRDLVIEQLVKDGPSRRRFLRACSLGGITLAVSTAGGSSGERELPLLREDGDWDALSDRLATAIPEWEEPELTRLLLSVGEARLVAEGNRELDALVRYALELVSRRWRRERAVVPVGLLASWFEVAADLPDAPDAPDVTATWIELLPVVPVDPASQAELVRFDEWTALADVLAQRAPDTLTTFEFPRRYRAVVRRFLDDLAGAPAESQPPARRQVLARTLRRLETLMPELADAAGRVLTRLMLVPAEGELPARYTPRPISPELQRILDAPAAPRRSDEALVARVLEDL